MTNTFRLLLISIMCFGGIPAQELVLRDDSGTYVRRVYTVRHDGFERRLITKLFDDAQRVLADRQLLHLQFFRDGQNELNFYLADVVMGSEIGPQPTKQHLYPKLRQAPLYLADVISIGGNAVLEMRDPQHGVRRLVIAGNDPLHLSIDGQPAEIIHIGYAPDFQRRGFIPVVFVRTTTKLDPAWGLMIYKELASRLRVDFTLSVRNDAWFLDANEFPVFWAYGDPGSMPTAEAYLKTQEMTCVTNAGLPKCTVSSADSRPSFPGTPLLKPDRDW